ncbi:hypothetical protein BGZ63DRAFT_215445 [Mariannaea sp. PMI_226]|nr:hypothetical protein BGZ63DRAFT_215445 [Mariannaea sp. PMI_226]
MHKGLCNPSQGLGRLAPDLSHVRCPYRISSRNKKTKVLAKCRASVEQIKHARCPACLKKRWCAHGCAASFLAT